MAFASQTIQVEDYAAHLQASWQKNSEAGSQLTTAMTVIQQLLAENTNVMEISNNVKYRLLTPRR